MKSDKKALEPVYFIYSSHRLLLKEAVERLAAQVGSDDSGVLDVRRFSGSEVDIEEAIVACQTLSFLGGARVVIINDALRLNPAAAGRLISYVDNPNPQTILVLTQAVGDKQVKRQLESNTVFKACRSAKHCRVSEYEIKSGVSSWIKTKAASHGKNIDQAAVGYLLTWVGADLYNLSAEISKLCDAAGADPVITLELAKQVVATKNEVEVFDLIGAVVDRNVQAAFVGLASLFEKDSTAANVIGLIERQFRLMLRTKTFGRGLSGQKLASKLGVSAGQAFYLEKQSRAFSISAIQSALSKLVEADFKRKTGSLPPRLVLETLLFDLASLS